MSSYLIWSLWSFVKVGSIVEEATRIGNSGAKSREEELKEVEEKVAFLFRKVSHSHDILRWRSTPSPWRGRRERS